MNAVKAIGLSFLCAIICVASILYLRRNQSRSLPSADTLVIGMMSGWPPYMNIDGQGQYVGFDVDVANTVGKQLGKKVEIKDIGSLATLFLSLEQGKIDMIFSGLDITEERKRRMTLIPYVGEDTTSIYVVFYKQVPQGIKNLNDIAKISRAVVCVEANSTSDKLIDLYPSITKKQLKSMSDMVLDVRAGKSMAFIAEPPVARRLFKKDPELKSIQVSLPKELRIYGCGIAIKKDNEKLASSVASAIKILRSSDQLEILEKKWTLKNE